MIRSRSLRLRRWLPAAALTASAVLTGVPSMLEAQVSDTAHGQASGKDQQMAQQLQELRAEVARLRMELQEQRRMAQQPAPPSGQPSGGMGQPMEDMDKMEAMDKMEMGGMGGGAMGGMSGGMGMMDMHEGEMGMPPEGMEMPPGMMTDDMDEMGMGGMSSGVGMGGKPSGSGMAPGAMSGGPAGGSRMPGGAKAPKSMSALPGVPGGSHLYHIGSTGFFLDQPQIALASEQRGALNKIKERALLERENADRRIEQAEQELWVLTGADRPDAGKIEAKMREIERLRSNQRLAFVQAVGEATKQLTPEQRRRLLGTGSSPAK